MYLLLLPTHTPSPRAVAAARELILAGTAGWLVH